MKAEHSVQSRKWEKQEKVVKIGSGMLGKRYIIRKVKEWAQQLWRNVEKFTG